MRSGVARCLNGRISIGSFRNDFHIGLGIDQHLQPGAENRVIVCDQILIFVHAGILGDSSAPTATSDPVPQVGAAPESWCPWTPT